MTDAPDNVDESPDGWRDTVSAAIDQLRALNIEVIEAKSKWGALRIYFSEIGHDADTLARARAIISDATACCSVVCEDCGSTDATLVQDSRPALGIGVATTCTRCWRRRLYRGIGELVDVIEVLAGARDGWTPRDTLEEHLPYWTPELLASIEAALDALGASGVLEEQCAEGRRLLRVSAAYATPAEDLPGLVTEVDTRARTRRADEKDELHGMRLDHTSRYIRHALITGKDISRKLVEAYALAVHRGLLARGRLGPAPSDPNTREQFINRAADIINARRR